MLRFILGCVGALALGLGVIGIFVPLLPTVPLVLLSAACFAKASPRVEAWLLAHPRFGPSIRDWRARGAISRRGKVAAGIGKAVGYGLFLAFSSPPLWLALLVLACLLGVAAYVFTRPE